MKAAGQNMGIWGAGQSDPIACVHVCVFLKEKLLKTDPVPLVTRGRALFGDKQEILQEAICFTGILSLSLY